MNTVTGKLLFINTGTGKADSLVVVNNNNEQIRIYMKSGDAIEFQQYKGRLITASITTSPSKDGKIFNWTKPDQVSISTGGTSSKSEQVTYSDNRSESIVYQACLKACSEGVVHNAQMQKRLVTVQDYDTFARQLAIVALNPQLSGGSEEIDDSESMTG